jgi:hypothetical protein
MKYDTSLLIVQKSRIMLSFELLAFIKGIFEKDQGINQIFFTEIKPEGDLAKEVANIRAGYGEFYIHRQDVFEDKSFPFTLQTKE